MMMLTAIHGRSLSFAASMVAVMLGGCATPQSSYPVPVNPPPFGIRLVDAEAAHVHDLSQPLAPATLASIAVFTNPDLRALRQREQVAQAQLFAAGLLPDPAFSLGFDEPQGQGLVTALAGSVGLDLAAFARRPFEISAARSNLAAVRSDIVWAEWLTSEQAKLLAVRTAHLRQIKLLTFEFRSITEDELQRTLSAVSRGDLPGGDLEVKRLAATDAADRDRSAEAQLNAAELDLNRVLGIDPSEQIVLVGPSRASTQAMPVGELFQLALASRTDLAALKAGYASAGAATDLARLNGYPLPSLAINAARDTGNIKSLGPSLSFSLPLWNRGRGDVAIARAGRAQLQAEYAARVEAIRADIAAARSAHEIARAQNADVQRELAPLLPQAEASQRAAERGDISVSAARATRLAVLDKQIIQAGLAQSEAELVIALEIATGQTLESNQ